MKRLFGYAKAWHFNPMLPFILAVVAVAGCATEGHRTITPQTVATYKSRYNGPKYALVVSNFQNRSSYQRGLFSDGQDRLGSQATYVRT